MTVPLQTLAQGFSATGMPVFLSDVKGDLSGAGNAKTEGPQRSACGTDTDEYARFAGSGRPGCILVRQRVNSPPPQQR